MNKEQLTTYKQTLEEEVKAAEQGLERVKMEISNKKRMIKLCDEQLKSLPEEKEKV